MLLLLRMTLLILGILDPGICAIYIKFDRFYNIFTSYNFTLNFSNRNLRILEGIKHQVPLLTYKEEAIDWIRHTDSSRQEPTVVIDDKVLMKSATGHSSGIDAEVLLIGIDGYLFIDGRMGWDGWMVGPLFFFGPYLENYFIIFVNCFISLKYMFLHIFWNIRGKKSECSFFQKASPKSGVGFFFDFLNTNSQISRKQLDIFF